MAMVKSFPLKRGNSRGGKVIKEIKIFISGCDILSVRRRPAPGYQPFLILR